MSGVIDPSMIPDMVLATLDELNKGKWIGMMTNLREHAGFNEFCKNRQKKALNGLNYTLRYVMDHTHSTKQVGYFATQTYAKTDAFVEGTVPMRNTQSTSVFDKMMMADNSGAAQIVDLAVTEDKRMYASHVAFCEKQVWSCPTSTADNESIYGVSYWITKNATVGFNGGNHASFATGKAGISSVTYPRYKNYSGAYATVDDTSGTGLIDMMERGAIKMKRMAVTPEPGMGHSGGGNAIFTNLDTFMKMKQVTKDANDSLGFDLSTAVPTFRGMPLRMIPYFDADERDDGYVSDNPVYMLDFSHFYPIFREGWDMVRSKQDPLPNQVSCFGIVLTQAWNLVCDDLRTQAVFYDSTTTPVVN